MQVPANLDLDAAAKQRLHEAVTFILRMGAKLPRLRRIYERKKLLAPMGSVRLAGLRVAFGLTRKELADALGVRVGDVFRWEEGTGEPSREISAVLRTLDCPANRALFGASRWLARWP